MSWLKSDTLWVFYSGSAQQNHIGDIWFAIFKLMKTGIDPSRIVAFVPTTSMAEVTLFGISNVFDVCDFDANFVSRNLSSTRVFFTATGHGSMRGLDFRLSTGQQAFVAPHHLLSVVRAVKGVQFGVIVLGQCMAGVFNLMEAKKENHAELCTATARRPVKSKRRFFPSGLDIFEHLIFQFKFW